MFSLDADEWPTNFSHVLTTDALVSGTMNEHENQESRVGTKDAMTPRVHQPWVDYITNL